MVRTREIDQQAYSIYKQKAEQAYLAMNLALENNLWAPAGREAVFACINICDALLAKHKRLRNISKDHMDVVKIVSTVLTSYHGAKYCNCGSRSGSTGVASTRLPRL